MSCFHLKGLRGSNPLGFLAALGVLRTASEAWSRDTDAVTMGWTSREQGYHPVLVVPQIMTDDDQVAKNLLLAGLHQRLAVVRGHPVFSFSDDLKVTVADFHALLLNAASQAAPCDHLFADILSGLATDGVGTAEDEVKQTRLCTMSGAGHQHFLGSIRELVECTTQNDLESALFRDWTYSDGRPSMRWDPTDDRRYALRWGDPSNTAKNPIRTVRGANRLAIEALPLLPVFPTSGDAATVGFALRGRRVFWTWPIWSPQVPLDVVRSLLALKELQDDEPPRERLGRLGVVEIYRCERFTWEKYKNFSRAWPV